MSHKLITEAMVNIAARIAIAVHPGYVSQQSGRVFKFRVKTGRRTKADKPHWAKLGSLSFEYIEFLASADPSTQENAIEGIANRWRNEASRKYPGWDTHVC